jgi:hypothetical protein
MSQYETEFKGRRPMSQVEDLEAERRTSFFLSFCSIQASMDGIILTHTAEGSHLYSIY